MNKNSIKALKTKEALIHSFCLIYLDTPIEKITINAITKKAGYYRSTFYLYFKDIYDLREYVENEFIKYTREKMLIALKQGNASKYMIKSLIDIFVNKELEATSLLGRYGSNNFTERFKAINSSKLLELIFPNIQDNNKAMYLLNAHLSTVISTFQLWIENNKDLTIDELVNIIYHLSNDGISYFNHD